MRVDLNNVDLILVIGLKVTSFEKGRKVIILVGTVYRILPSSLASLFYWKFPVSFYNEPVNSLPIKLVVCAVFHDRFPFSGTMTCYNSAAIAVVPFSQIVFSI